MTYAISNVFKKMNFKQFSKVEVTCNDFPYYILTTDDVYNCVKVFQVKTLSTIITASRVY